MGKTTVSYIENRIPVAMIVFPYIRQDLMISNSPQNEPPVFSLEQEAVDSGNNNSGNNNSGLEIWLDGIADHWPKSVKKVKKSDPLLKVGKKSIKQLCYGLDSNLLERLDPLVSRVSTKTKGGHEFEQLASLVESAAVSIDALSNFTPESFSPEVIETTAEAELPLLSAFTSLLVASRLRDVVLRGSDQEFERIIRSLLALQQSAVESEPQSPLVFQWLAIELPLTIASQLYALKPFKKAGKHAAKQFVNVTRYLLDSDGWPSTSCHKQFGPLAASWTRCMNLAKVCKYKLGSSFHAQMEWVAEQFVRLHGPDNKLHFAGEHAPETKPSFVKFVLQLDSDGRGKKLAQVSGLLPSDGKKKKHDLGLEPTCISEWAGSAILKGSWLPKSPALAIDFTSPHCFAELSAGERLLSGRLATEIRINGEPVEIANGEDGFEVNCDFVDDDVSYLELELQLADMSIFRQLLLSKVDRFLFFADSVKKTGAGEIDYRISLPLAKGINVIRENGTRELYLNLKGSGIQSLVLPLSLPEWTSERCRGLLSAEEDESRGIHVLNLERVVQIPEEGGALYCPAFFDLDPNRSRLKRTWRSLTVAENLGIVSSEVAAAFRVQVDEEQWVFYRALREIANRTFIGQNFSGDFFAGKFATDGRVKELVEVE